ncbi:hypothetical protein H6F50_11350 [Coleofasciculus sp. FACHB-712]|uniref:hypothetical protein n=1 Tax=Cyanophyceae TaxID=3028117 RepID=UPI001682D6A0|nr:MULTISPECIES: hypothetical protein [unclassified Coleofasciculus]MBD1942948.1 hypothetical protein [Coleofasciculus sp. FACHB-712]
MIHPVGRLFPDEDNQQDAIAVEKPNPRGHNDKTPLPFQCYRRVFPDVLHSSRQAQSTCCKRTFSLGLYR